MLPGIEPDQFRLMQIFMPRAFGKQITAFQNKQRFVHYTSAEAALKIFESEEIWMRKSSCMNDFMEVEHGLDCVHQAVMATQNGERFRNVIDSIGPDLWKEIGNLFDGWVPRFRGDTYFTCISEHDLSEDTIGRLSMWRAYSGGVGVAMVVNNAPFLSISDTLKAYTSPVAYLDKSQVETELLGISNSIDAELDFLRSLPRATVVGYVFEMLRWAVLCVKHPGFLEEKEWRIVYQPSMEKSEYLKRDIVTIGGVPQPIFKIPLKEYDGLSGTKISELLDRVIIGPCNYPSAIYEAFLDALSRAGVHEPEKRIFISDIPLRR